MVGLSGHINGGTEWTQRQTVGLLKAENAIHTAGLRTDIRKCNIKSYGPRINYCKAWVISGFSCCVTEAFALLGCYAAWLGS
jgi:hypothetical protein